ncbi:21471_t:CDS:1, partial [Racocetra persica]
DIPLRSKPSLPTILPIPSTSSISEHQTAEYPTDNQDQPLNLQSQSNTPI